MADVVERWREPVLGVNHEEAYVLTSDNTTERSVRHELTGPDQEKTLARMMLGMLCSQCLTPWPAPPRVENAHMFKQGQMNYVGLRSEEEALKLVADGCCPICGCEAAMANATFEGFKELTGEIREHK